MNGRRQPLVGVVVTTPSLENAYRFVAQGCDSNSVTAFRGELDLNAIADIRFSARGLTTGNILLRLQREFLSDDWYAGATGDRHRCDGTVEIQFVFLTFIGHGNEFNTSVLVGHVLVGIAH